MKYLGTVGVITASIGLILLMFGNGFGIIGLVFGCICITDPSYQK